MTQCIMADWREGEVSFLELLSEVDAASHPGLLGHRCTLHRPVRTFGEIRVVGISTSRPLVGRRIGGQAKRVDFA